MENIFKNAYFGKAYRTRNGKKAIYLGYTNNSIYHICFIEDESNKTLYFNNGDAWGHQRKGNNVDDIVSEWQEVNEEELDKLAEQANPYPSFDKSDMCVAHSHDGFYEGFIEGYRLASKQ